MSQWFLIPTPETLNVNRFIGQTFHMTPLLAHLSHSLYWNNWESNYKCKPFIKLTVKPDVLVLVIKCYFFWDANLLCYLYILTKNTTCTKKRPGLVGRLTNQKASWGGVGHFFGGWLICFCHFVKIHQNLLFGWSITKELPMCTGTLLLVSGWPRAIYPTHPLSHKKTIGMNSILVCDKSHNPPLP